jgi:hypothetical protein
MYIVVVMNVSCMDVIQTSKYGIENGRCIVVGRYKGSKYLSARFIRAWKKCPDVTAFYAPLN